MNTLTTLRNTLSYHGRLTSMLIFAAVMSPVLHAQKNDRIRINNDLELIRLTENAYMHVSYNDDAIYGRFASNGLIFINGMNAFLFDSPVTDSLTGILISWIEDSLGVRIKGFVPNHWHNDCMGGLAAVHAHGIQSYANIKTVEIARSKNLPVPLSSFSDSLMLDLNGKKILCYFPGAAHTTDNIVIWIPNESILFAGCMIKSIDALTLGNTADADMKAYRKTIEGVLEKFPGARYVIPGHGAPGDTGLILHTLDLID